LRGGRGRKENEGKVVGVEKAREKDAATQWDGRRPPCPPPCAADLRRERERAGGGNGRRMRGGREWDTGSRVRDLFI
jgi:hypothetical protein